ncbi:MAG: hypothetical protein ABIY70_04945 [Capsulimonas sp.]|uniref:hypothetical protein n=1 Tax=Capsulimonas sp. TaxID=2494211 RepID=UPI0032670E78
MEIQQALKEQYHAGLAMLAQCVENCPEDLWLEGAHPRTFWRIAFHAAFFTHLYMVQNEAAFQPWPGRREGIHQGLWSSPSDVEPYELPEGADIYQKTEMLDYIRFVDGLVDSTVDQLDLDTDDAGFAWYKNISKMSHQLMNLRHIQGHVGQLSELLMQKEIDIDWISQSPGL